MFTLMDLKLLVHMYLSSPNFPSDFAVLFLLKVKFVVYFVMTKMGANE